MRINLAAKPRACGIFNIKLMKCGGIYQAQRIAEGGSTGGHSFDVGLQ